MSINIHARNEDPISRKYLLRRSDPKVTRIVAPLTASVKPLPSCEPHSESTVKHNVEFQTSFSDVSSVKEIASAPLSIKNLVLESDCQNNIDFGETMQSRMTVGSKEKNVLVNHRPSSKILTTECVKSPQVIVRTFELPTRKLQGQGQLEFCKLKERWKYQHDISSSSADPRNCVQKDASHLKFQKQVITRLVSENTVSKQNTSVESRVIQTASSATNNSTSGNFISSDNVRSSLAPSLLGKKLHLVPISSEKLKELNNLKIINGKSAENNSLVLKPQRDNVTNLQELSKNAKVIDSSAQQNQTFKLLGKANTIILQGSAVSTSNDTCAGKRIVNPFIQGGLSKRPNNTPVCDIEGSNVSLEIHNEKTVQNCGNPDYQTIHVEIVANESNSKAEGQEKSLPSSNSKYPQTLSSGVMQNKPQVSSSNLSTNIVKLLSSPRSHYKKVILKPNENGDLKIAFPEGSESGPITAVPKDSQEVLREKLKKDFILLKYRQDVALQYQRDLQKMKEQPRILRTINLPQRTVQVADVLTQTSLFSLIEPGRMVEMTESKSNNAVTASKTVQKRCTLSPSTPNGNNIAVRRVDGPESKRIRLDIGDFEGRKIRLQDNGSQDVLMDTHDASSVLNNVHAAVQQRPMVEIPLNTQAELLNSISSQTSNIYISDIDLGGYENINLMSFNNNQKEIISKDTNKNMIQKENEQYNNKNIILGNKELLYKTYEEWSKCLKEDDNGNLPIHNAVYDGNLPIVRRQCCILTACRESVDVPNKDGETPLHLAVLFGNVKIVEELLKYKANPDVVDRNGNTSLHLAVDAYSNFECLKAILLCVEKNSRILDQDNEDGYSPLHLCTINGKEKEALLLIKKGADINLKDKKSGRTALFHAVENQNKSMSSLLVRHGANILEPNFSGQTPSTACEPSMLYCIQREKLLEKGKTTLDIDENFILEDSSNTYSISNISFQNDCSIPLFSHGSNDEEMIDLSHDSSMMVVGSQYGHKIIKDR